MSKQSKRPKKGRPKIEIDWGELDKLCALMCTLTDIAYFFDCSEDTVERRIKEKTGMTFAEYFEVKSSEGKISLRISQFQLAKKNATMAIFLGKNYLGQKDRYEQEIEKTLHYDEDGKPELSELSDEELFGLCDKYGIDVPFRGSSMIK